MSADGPLSGCGAPIRDRRCTACDRPALADLYCCQGGASAGYQAAGFCTTGVDLAPQPRYPWYFIQADAIQFIYLFNAWFVACHASPPCQHWSDLAHRNGNADAWPDLIAPTRDALETTGVPWVIENVERTPLYGALRLCGTQFPGLRVLRHRLFETSPDWSVPELPHGRHPLVFTMDKRKAHYGRLDQDTAFVQVTGGGNATLANKRAAMGGLDWMDSHGVNEAIPAAYSAHVGRALLAHLAASGEAA